MNTVLSLQEPEPTPAPTPAPKCEPISVPLCSDLSYSETVMPNALGHKTQEEAGLNLHYFYPLVKVDCSPALKPFLCSVYTPECVSGKPRPPCRALCEEAHSTCEPLLRKFGFDWPNSLRCDLFDNESCSHVSLTLLPAVFNSQSFI